MGCCCGGKEGGRGEAIVVASLAVEGGGSGGGRSWSRVVVGCCRVRGPCQSSGSRKQSHREKGGPIQQASRAQNLTKLSSRFRARRSLALPLVLVPRPRQSILFFRCVVALNCTQSYKCLRLTNKPTTFSRKKGENLLISLLRESLVYGIFTASPEKPVRTGAHDIIFTS